jgi:LAO/AO transport system kinase
MLADQTRLGRLLSQLENDPRRAGEVLARLPESARSKRAQRVGFTGSPGVGKSTLLAKLVQYWRSAGRRTGIVAVDPSSPFSGGAIMADRLRWVEQAGPDVFVRSLASRGSLGGVSAGAGAVASLIEAAGYDPLLIETVGVGQTGFDVLALADTIVVLFSPESGDGLQMLKAGLLEAGDIIVINKSDRPGAEAMRKEVELALDLSQPLGGGDIEWTSKVIPTSATNNEGIEELAEQLAAHRTWISSLPAAHPRRLRRVRSEIIYTLRALFSQALEGEFRSELDVVSGRVLAGEVSLWDGVEQLLARCRQSL